MKLHIVSLPLLLTADMNLHRVAAIKSLALGERDTRLLASTTNG